MSRFPEHILRKITVLPESPGVYQFYNNKGDILYVGKAKNLKKRVSSYFHSRNHESYKSKVLVNKIADIQHIVVESESDALLLENNLIKKLKPRYNVLLKDDKTFPWICIKNEPFPRVFLTRKVINDGSKYYGPYTSAHTARILLKLIQKLYKLRTCNFALTSENIESGKFKVCLEYHIENCNGPCEGYQDESSYNDSIHQIHEILKGNLQNVMTFLKTEMKRKAESYQFETAEKLKQKYKLLEQFQVKSTIVNPAINNVDVYSIVDEDKYAIVNYLKISKGAVVQAHNMEIKKRLNETTREILAFAITNMMDRIQSDAKEIIVPMNMKDIFPWYKITQPMKGDKKKLLELSQRNARIYKIEKEKRNQESKPVSNENRILNTIKNDLRLNKLPVHIECFDNSNIQGSDPVAACVVFKNARPAKKEYRHYNIKTVIGADDYASMTEVVYRRYCRLIEENKTLPQLVIIDGGKGQLNAALRSMEELKIRDKVAIIGIAKKLEEIYFPGDPVPLYIDKNSESLKLIQQLRNEAHRFGIEFHRLKRSSRQTYSSLESSAGIGMKSIEKLFQEFKSIETMKRASLKELRKVLDDRRAEKVYVYFNEPKV